MNKPEGLNEYLEKNYLTILSDEYVEELININLRLILFEEASFLERLKYLFTGKLN